MKRMRKQTLGPDELASIIGPILNKSPDWAESVRDLMQGRPEAFNEMCETEAIPPSVQPVLKRLAEGKSMRLDGRPRARPFEVEARVWNIVMCQRHLGARDREAERVAAAETNLSPGQVAGIVEDFVRAGLTLETWRAAQPAERLALIEVFRRK